MRREQKSIYTEEDKNVFHAVPPVNKKVRLMKIKTKIFSFIKMFFALHKFITPIGILIVLAWNFLGQIFLPPDMRLSYVIGQRVGEIDSKAINTALPEEAKKASAIAKEQAAVEVDKSCVSLRNERALQTFYECQVQGGTQYLCEFRRDQIQKQHCGSFNASQHNPQQEGNQP